MKVLTFILSGLAGNSRHYAIFLILGGGLVLITGRALVREIGPEALSHNLLEKIRSEQDLSQRQAFTYTDQKIEASERVFSAKTDNIFQAVDRIDKNLNFLIELQLKNQSNKANGAVSGFVPNTGNVN
jgi:hypothetical protein